jgi:V-type H+-transporting ATPase subunit H
MDRAELTNDQVLKRDIPWETYMSTKLISGTYLQRLRRYDHKPDGDRARLLDEDGPGYIQMFLHILRSISKEDTVEYVLALIDDILTTHPERVPLFYDKSLSGEDIYEPFLRLLWKGSWFVQEKSCKILTHIVSARPKLQNGMLPNGEASNSKSKLTSTDDVIRGLVDWICSQLRNPTHPNLSAPTAIHCLSNLLKKTSVRTLFVQADGVKLLIPLISPASTQQSTQFLYETCLCIWLLSFYDAAVDYLSTTRVMPRLVEVVKSSTKEKVVRVVVMSLRNLLAKGAFAAQMIDLGMLQIVQNLKAQAWTDEDLLDALNQLEVTLKDSLKKLSSFDKYKQQVLLGHLDFSPMHKDPMFWRENINNFEENDFQILRVLMTVIDTSTDTTALAVACYDLSQFLQYHPSGRIVVADLKAKDRVMKLMNHDNAEVRKNALLCVQRLFLGAKYASFMQA